MPKMGVSETLEIKKSWESIFTTPREPSGFGAGSVSASFITLTKRLLRESHEVG